jgi:hypothetical protein
MMEPDSPLASVLWLTSEPPLAPAIMDQSAITALLDQVDARLREVEAERARLLSARVALMQLIHRKRVPGTGAMLKGYLDSLQPGDPLDIGALLEYGRSTGWTCGATDERAALLGRLAKWAKDGRVARIENCGPGKYRKLTADEQAALLSRPSRRSLSTI